MARKKATDKTKNKNQKGVTYDYDITERKHLKTIGGTDAMKVAEGKWLEVWKSKQDDYIQEDLSDILPVQMGINTEPFNRYWFTKQTGIGVTEGCLIQDDELYFAHANVDGLTDNQQVFEAKHTSLFNVSKVPEKYYAQVQHYMMMTNFEQTYLSVFGGNSSYKIFEIKADYEFITKLIYAESHLYSFIESGIAPPEYVDFNAMTVTELKGMTNGTGKRIEVPLQRWVQTTEYQ